LSDETTNISENETKEDLITENTKIETTDEPKPQENSTEESEQTVEEPEKEKTEQETAETTEEQETVVEEPATTEEEIIVEETVVESETPSVEEPEQTVEEPEKETVETEQVDPQVEEETVVEEPATTEEETPPERKTEPVPEEKPEPKPTPQKVPQAPKEGIPESSIMEDEEILKFIEDTKQKIYVIGTGGSGSNTVDRLFEIGVKGVSLMAMNTDARHLLDTRANRKLILGKKKAGGRGAGSNPLIGEESARECQEELTNMIGEGELVFITCGMGGGTGTGSAPVIAEIAKKAGALTVAVVTLPFSSEGKIRMENALSGLDKLKKHVDTLIVIKNDRLLTLVPDLPLNTAFKVCDEVLAGSVKGIAELVTKSGLVNVDFADLRTILSDGGFAVIGLGDATLDAKHEDRARIAIETALNSPMLDAEVVSASRALINVIGGEDMTLKEAEYVVSETAKRIDPHAHIIWGARIEEDMKKASMRVLVVLAGVRFPKQEIQPHVREIETLDLELIG